MKRAIATLLTLALLGCMVFAGFAGTAAASHSDEQVVKQSNTAIQVSDDNKYDYDRQTIWQNNKAVQTGGDDQFVKQTNWAEQYGGDDQFVSQSNTAIQR